MILSNLLPWQPIFDLIKLFPMTSLRLLKSFINLILVCAVLQKEYFAPFAHIYDPRFSELIMELVAILKMTKNWPFWKNCVGVFILFKNIDKHLSPCKYLDSLPLQT